MKYDIQYHITFSNVRLGHVCPFCNAIKVLYPWNYDALWNRSIIFSWAFFSTFMLSTFVYWLCKVFSYAKTFEILNQGWQKHLYTQSLWTCNALTWFTHNRVHIIYWIIKRKVFNDKKWVFHYQGHNVNTSLNALNHF